ncbi:hypothetical protein CHCC14820_3092 [Bacillus paralicheniformis]|uniref:Uncharacterized protein n=1 Tax=Bacillus paralicheniformis TaxID=1648923 RepID=A0A7Z0X0P9_9BACI|nr:hypothetical protein B4121_1375 [Bacillus paralicheniformis]OLG03489.1 hypothetical protein B4123_4211 [Bacillus paralicheniformis]TWJ33895.1 hypothetical protein CHCC5027_3629 [Bacillus paralicheniformis]TWJ49848.1 hypothetical protein CHCC5022_3168 [Bacillus paralicheniformis]TWJ59060.1 hypothetical protein CHCC5023_0108 [Bacillus paralicheniformis]
MITYADPAIRISFFSLKKNFFKKSPLKIYTFYTFYSLLLQGLIFDLS